MACEGGCIFSINKTFVAMMGATVSQEGILVRLFVFEGFSVCLCVNSEWKDDCCGQVLRVGLEGGHPHIYTNRHTHLSTRFFFLFTRMKSLFRPLNPLQAQLWSVTLVTENISFTLCCLLIYKKANPRLKIAWLVWNSGRMKQTLSGTQMLKTTFIFHSSHVITLLFFYTNEKHYQWLVMLNTGDYIYTTLHTG